MNYAKWDKMNVSDSDDDDDKAGQNAGNIMSSQASSGQEQEALSQMLQGMPRVPQYQHAYVDQMKTLPAGVTSSNILQSILDSCVNLVSIAETEQYDNENVHINMSAVRKMASQLNADKISSLHGKKTAFTAPLRFPTPDSHMNFWCIHEVLKYGSGWEDEIKEKCSVPDFEALVTRGLIALFLTNPKLDSEFLRQLSAHDIAKHFSIPLTESVRVGTALTMDKPSQLKSLAESFAHTLFECGVLLFRLKCKDFAEFVKKQQAINSSAEFLVYSLVTNFPAFDDHFAGIKPPQAPPSHPMYFSKALSLTNKLHYLFAHGSPPTLISFQHISNLPAAATPSLFATLVSCGIIVLPLPARTPKLEVQSGSELECAVRAATLVACDELAKLLANSDTDTDSSTNAHQIGCFLEQTSHLPTPLPADVLKVQLVGKQTRFY
eukprot:c7318_g1_i1.p1 GENE.c7318_g1_i1~~c7318_g1_i1.p1  ORF type:complete len:448 (-),score=107.42 c7318_g1_i1:245-1552(-)